MSLSPSRPNRCDISADHLTPVLRAVLLQRGREPDTRGLSVEAGVPSQELEAEMVRPGQHETPVTILRQHGGFSLQRNHW